MKRSKFARIFLGTSLAVALAPLLRNVLSIALCGLLLTNSSTCYVWSGSQLAKAADLPNETHIAIPPIIRPPSINLQDALPSDFVVSRQTPYSSGRNEILIVSPSTGTEQRFEINLPNTGSFRIYQASFSNVQVADPSIVVRDGVSLSPADIQAKLANFTITFDSNNSPDSATLADGTKAEFSASTVVVRSADGRVIETVVISSLLPPDDLTALLKSSNQTIAQGNSCVGRIRDQIYTLGQKNGTIADALKNAKSDEGKAFAWTLTYGKRALEDSLVAGTRNQTLQEIACNPPVQCNQEQRYQGGSVIRTDLFQLPGGRDQRVDVKYEFYDIPDRLEIYLNGEMYGSIPDGTGYISGNSSKPFVLPNGAAYVGVKLIGNEDSNTKWWYTISCSGESVPADLMEAREIARRLAEVYPGWKEGLDPCPRTSDDADQSNLFEEDNWIERRGVLYYHPGASRTYRSTAESVEAYPSQDPELPGAAPLFPGQQCTYDGEGRLITGGTGAGTPDAYSPAVTPELSYLHTAWDINPSEVMSLREYHQTWTPNNGSLAPENIVNKNAGVWKGRL